MRLQSIQGMVLKHRNCTYNFAIELDPVKVEWETEPGTVEGCSKMQNKECTLLTTYRSYR